MKLLSHVDTFSNPKEDIRFYAVGYVVQVLVWCWCDGTETYTDLWLS